MHEYDSDTLNARRKRTNAKTEKLRALGYEVIEMWQCNYNSNVRDNHPMLNNIPLNPRDAFYGGRTGNTRKHYKAKAGEKIKYIDICSLYPWVCKYQKYPVGHPELLIGDECYLVDLRKTDGFIKCQILPPQDLYHPVLPTKMNNKLMFVLCRTCGEKNQNECNHNEAERALTGTWVIDEVLKALEKGYTILSIFEIWRYKTVQQGDTTDGLFTKFINKFLKIKQQASGWPSDCTNQQQKDEYIRNYMEHEGVELEESQIAKNGGLRSMSKLMLNSFWGKFGQRENQSKSTFVRQPKELYDLLTNNAIYINSVREINDEVLIVNWEYKEEAVDTLSTVNVCIAAYTTAHARLKLYSYLEELQDRVLYYDTDSVIYVSSEGSKDPPTGSFLGDMTDELEGEYGIGSYIAEFISGGPKNYGFEVFSTAKNKLIGKCKVKGFSLNYKVSQLINLTSMRESVTGENVPIPIVTNNIRRTAQHDVITTLEEKNYRATSTKRKFFSNNDSLPYGHKKLCN